MLATSDSEEVVRVVRTSTCRVTQTIAATKINRVLEGSGFGVSVSFDFLGRTLLVGTSAPSAFAAFVRNSDDTEGMYEQDGPLLETSNPTANQRIWSGGLRPGHWWTPSDAGRARS